MANPLDGKSALPERDAYWQGLTENYQREIEISQRVIDLLPLHFVAKGKVAEALLHIMLIRRYCQYAGRDFDDLGITDMMLTCFGGDELKVIAEKLGYGGEMTVVNAFAFIDEKVQEVLAETRRAAQVLGNASQ